MPSTPLTPTATALPADPTGEDYARLATEVQALLGIDLLGYKPTQVWRRTRSFATQKGFRDLWPMLQAAWSDAPLKDALRDMLTINVTEFFRDPAAWKALETRHLPELLKRPGQLRVWSAASSFGQEPYSLAMLFLEANAAHRARITATDIDRRALDRAREGVYSAAELGGLSPERRERFGVPTPDGGLRLKADVKALVIFKPFDLLRDEAPVALDLLVCRNVLIYFTEEAKEAVIARFVGAVRPDGILFLGATEAIVNARSHGLEPLGASFYRRLPDPATLVRATAPATVLASRPAGTLAVRPSMSPVPTRVPPR